MPVRNRIKKGRRPRTRKPRDVEVRECFQVLVECEDEAQQRIVYQRMTAEGHKCRLLTL